MKKEKRTHFGKKSLVILKKGKEIPFINRHPWVFSGAIEKIKGNPENGELVDLANNDKKFIAKGFINFNSQIRVRLLTWDIHEKINKDFFKRKIEDALYFRDKILALKSKSNAYRIVHGEADGLPGLIIDKYNKYISAQFLSYGMDKRKDIIIEIIREVTKIDTIIERYTAGYRKLEGMEEIEYKVHGKGEPSIEFIDEYGVKFKIHLERGQKTGFYLDQRENRQKIVKYGYQRKVLDAFCYTGGFGINLLKKSKAKHVTFLDSSKLSLELLKENLEINGCDKNKVRIEKIDIFKKLENILKENKYDFIILDPPKVAPDKDSYKKGIEALKNINKLSLEHLERGGILVTFDCSGIINWENFIKIIKEASIKVNKNIKIIEKLTASSDHPYSPYCPESDYLKGLILVVL